MKNPNHSRHVRRAVWMCSLVAFGFLFCQAHRANAQVTGSGTINKIPKWSPTPAALADSVIFDNGFVGIGTTNPGSKLEVAGDVRGKASGPAFFLYDTSGAVDTRQFYFWNSGGTIYGRWVNDANSAVAAEAIAFKNNGNVGIGTTAPAQLVELFQNTNANVRLQVTNPNPGSFSTAGFRLSAGNTASADAIIWKSSNAVTSYGGVDSLNIYQSGNFPIAFLTNDAVRLFVKGDGNVGIGTTTPIYKLEVAGSTNIKGGQLLLGPSTAALDASIEVGANGSGNRYGFIDIVTDGTYTDYGLRLIRDNTGPNANSQLWHRGTGNLYLGAIEAGQVILRTNYADRMTIDSQGKVGIGTTPSPQYTLDVGGNVNASGTISGGNIVAKYQDVAEWVPSSRAIAAGTVVVLDAERSNHVLPSTHTYDTRVAGVVSANPGVILGEGGEGKVMVATTGRVRVKVDATNAPIRVGDLLVTSDKEGIAMRSQPVDIGGTPFHRPGTLIGKALEPLEKGTGEILVLLSLQ